MFIIIFKFQKFFSLHLHLTSFLQFFIEGDSGGFEFRNTAKKKNNNKVIIIIKTPHHRTKHRQHNLTEVMQMQRIVTNLPNGFPQF